MATYTNLATGEVHEFTPFAELSEEQKTTIESHNGDYDLESEKLELARRNLGLDKLIDDRSEWVREYVARLGYGLDVLVDDSSPMVRGTVARQGYGLETLIKDNNYLVRDVVAEKGYGFDVLCFDPDPYVRGTVASKGYGLDRLAFDESSHVRSLAAVYLSENGFRTETVFDESGVPYQRPTWQFDEIGEVRVSKNAVMLWSTAHPDQCVEEENKHPFAWDEPNPTKTPETNPRMVDGPNLVGDIKQGAEVAKNMTQQAPQRQRGPQTV